MSLKCRETFDRLLMIENAQLARFIGLYGDRALLFGIGGLFGLWLFSKRHIWLPWWERHPVAADLLLILGGAYFIVTPLAQPGAPGGHDLYFHLSRVAELNWLFQDGYYYGRWTPDFNYGFGYPLFDFYPPFIYYLAQLFRIPGVGMVDALKFVIVSGIALSGAFMYLFGRVFWGRYGAVVCAVAYMYAPYRLVNLYVRGAIPEFYAMTFIPLIFWSVYRLICTRRVGYLVIAAFGYGLLIATHNVTAVFLTLCLIGYGGFLLLDDVLMFGKSLTRTLRHAGLCLLTAGLGVGVSAIYWLPAMAEQQFVRISGLQTGYHDVAVHFVYFAQFFSRFWGYGGSGAGLQDGMSFQLGIAHLIAAGLSLAAIGCVWRIRSRERNQAIFFVALILILMFAMTSASLWFWRTFPLISFISFPWRLLSLTVFALSFLCGGLFLIDFRHWRFGRMWGKYGNRIVQLGLIGGLLACSAGYCRVGTPLPLSDEQLTREAMQAAPGAAMNGEYLPIWADKPAKNIRGGEIRIVHGEAAIERLQQDMLSYQFTVVATTAVAIRIGTVYFPGWNAYRNGSPLAVNPEDVTGLLSINLPAGEHRIDLRFEETPIRKFARYLSVGSLGILAGLSGFACRKHLS